MALASTILDRAERRLSFDRTSVGIPGLESTNLLTVVNAAVKEYFSSFELSGEPSSILRKEVGYTVVADTAVNNASGLAIGATSIIGDDFSEFADGVSSGTSGAIALWGQTRPDYAKFGSNNLTTTLSSVTGVSLTHEDDDAISLLYALPSDYDSLRSEEGYEDGVDIDGVPFFFTSGIPIGNRFSWFDDGTTKFLHFPQGITGVAGVRYNAAPTVVDGESDAVDVPTKDEDYVFWAVVKYAAPMLDRMDDYQIAMTEMLKILRSAHIRKNIGKRMKLRPMRTRKGFTRSFLFG